MTITDLDEWRRVCLAAFDNLRTDTDVTMAQVDRVLAAGAREYIALPRGSADQGMAKLLELHARIAAATGVEEGDVDAILFVTAGDAARLLAEA